MRPVGGCSPLPEVPCLGVGTHPIPPPGVPCWEEGVGTHLLDIPSPWTYPTHPQTYPPPGHTHPPGHIPQKGPGTRDTQPPNPAPSPSYEQTCENITFPQLRLLAVNIYRKKYITSFATRSPTSSLTAGREYM